VDAQTVLLKAMVSALIVTQHVILAMAHLFTVVLIVMMLTLIHLKTSYWVILADVKVDSILLKMVVVIADRLIYVRLGNIRTHKVYVKNAMITVELALVAQLNAHLALAFMLLNQITVFLTVQKVLCGIHMRRNANFYLRTAAILTKTDNVLNANTGQCLLEMEIANVNHLYKELEMDGVSI